MKKTILRKYANLIVRCGANVQKGQTVLVLADLDQPEFVQMVVDEAYKAGAAEVTATEQDSLSLSHRQEPGHGEGMGKGTAGILLRRDSRPHHAGI